ncbi:peptide deformylase [Bacteroidota bacterium]
MIYPILAYGTPSLRKVSEEISENNKELVKIIANIEDTMYNSDGIGLAAPQIGINKRIFIIDANPLAEDDESLKGFKKIFINPIITKRWGDDWVYNEGCLSIPGIREDITRKKKIIIEYFDENFNFFEEEYDEILARIIQHEYDHLDGILFTDHTAPIRKRLLKPKLRDISSGIVNVEYKMKFPLRK